MNRQLYNKIDRKKTRQMLRAVLFQNAMPIIGRQKLYLLKIVRKEKNKVC